MSSGAVSPRASVATAANNNSQATAGARRTKSSLLRVVNGYFGTPGRELPESRENTPRQPRNLVVLTGIRKL